MLQTALKVSWEDHIHNVDLYGKLPCASTKDQEKMALAGHCVRHPEVPANPLILWEPTQGQRSRGRQNFSNVDVLKKDAGGENREELTTLMLNRTEWREVSRRL